MKAKNSEKLVLTIAPVLHALEENDATKLIEAFLTAHDVSESSRQSYRKRLRQFFCWCTQNSIKMPTRETIVAYKRSLRERKFAPTSEGAYLVAVRVFFAWAAEQELHADVAANIKGPKRVRGFKRDPLTINQVHELLGSIDQSTLKGMRDFALINLMVRTGPRTIEISRACVDNISQQSGEVVLWLRGKGRDSADEFVVLTDSSLRPIMKYLAARGRPKPSEPLFGSTSDGNKHQRMSTRAIRRIVKQRLRGISLDSPRLSAHSMRHTAITMSLLAGVSVQEAQALARHSSIDTTMIYAHNLERAAGIPEKAIDSFLATTEKGQRTTL